YLISDFAKMERSPQLHVAFRALHAFRKEHNRSPKPWNADDADKLVQLAEQVAKTDSEEMALDKELIKKFSFICAGQLSPMQAVIGSLVAQELMKACSGKFVPIKQWFYFDALECLPDEPLSESDCAPKGSRYDGQIAVFGAEFQQKLGRLNYFVVGAGAIG